jgi:hypothetical protein
MNSDRARPYRKWVAPSRMRAFVLATFFLLVGCDQARVSQEATVASRNNAESTASRESKKAQALATVAPASEAPREMSAASVDVIPESADTSISAAAPSLDSSESPVDNRATGNLPSVPVPQAGTAIISVDRTAEIGLPKVFPWPPPRPSARLIINQQLVNSAIAPDYTLGRVADKLLESLTAAGYEGSGFLAAPNGFVIVTRVEQIDAQGSPVADRWIGEIAASGPFSLGNIIRLLLQAPAGYFRVIVFVVSDHPVAGGENRSDTLEILREWSQSSHLRLPPPLRLLPYNDSYSVVALIYEFEKHENGDDPGARVPGRLSAARHLENLKMRAKDTQYSLTDRVD